ncbi:ExeM/NucH family extracellular endonuclease [Actinoplanes sp. RD1]|uniref:ExeM/NucH family extracellular endonuclease n=1 Tax=Actinoplanes sp. RD1 TaxID=3064538 RepID=UPI0027428177|nr:ExeM/NucH family extracellular endonuclease [Actinoplanes sp. RD1]
MRRYLPKTRFTARSLGAAAVATAVGLTFTGHPVLAADATPFISEIHYDNTGTDSGEAIEVEAPAGFDLAGWSLVLYNGDNKSTYGTAAALSGTGIAVANYPANGVQNGSPDGVALVKPDGSVAEFLSYEGSFTAANGPAAGQASVDIGVSETGAEPAGQSLQKIDGAWTGPATSSFGVKNTGEGPGEPAPACSTAVTNTIAEVQGTTDTSPLAGKQVTVQGVVTADHRTGGYNGIYVQTAGTGGDRPVTAATPSDAIFVYLSKAAGTNLAIGDTVRVTGAVTEFNGLTELTPGALADVQVCDGDAKLPEPVALTLPLDAAARESLEGMLVAPAGTYTVSEVYDTNRYGEIDLAAGTSPARIPTDVAEPGSAAAAKVKSENALHKVVLDDGSSATLTGAPPYFSKEEPLRVGDQVGTFGATVFSYGFSEWRLQPVTPVSAATWKTAGFTFAHTNPRTAGPVDVGGDLRVASFNVLNYFVHFGGDARGADDAAALEKQQAKIVSAISALNADVVALMEIENSVRFEGDPQLALQTLVGALNAKDGAGTWDYVRTPAELPGAAQQDVITTAIIYKPAKATPKGASRSVNDESVWFNAREPIAQTFTSGSIDFTVIANHLKSKSTSDAATGDNADTGDGQGAFNGDRVRQATALAAFVEDVEKSSGTDKVILLGDFNAYTHEDPLQVLYDAGFSDLNKDKNSYVFGGESGSLDHALATRSLADRVTGVDIWNINSVESFSFQYDGYAPFYSADPYRASDHDPVVVGLNTKAAAQTPVDLQLLSVNDFHGRLESPSTVDGQPVGGAAQLVGMINQLRTQNPATAWVSAGDNIGASTFISAIDGDNPTIDALNSGGLAVSAVGNHEFDKGLADLTGRVSDRATFPYLGANVYKDGKRVLPGYDVQTVGGVKVGYIGVVTEQTASLVSPDGIAGVEFRDPVAEANQVAAELSDGNEANGEADVLVLLAHEGAAAENIDSAAKLQADPVFGDFTRVSADIDAILSGHTHQPYAFEVPVPGTDRTRPVIQAEDYGLRVGRAVLTYDPATKAVTKSTAELLDVKGYTPDPAVADIVTKAKATATELGKQPLGKITADIKRAYVTGTDGTVSEDRGSESVLGNFIADVQLDQTSAAGRGGAQIAFMNPGGLRADLKFGTDGTITYADAFAVQPFANDVVTQTLTGAQIKQVLEEQWQPAGASRPVLHLGSSKGLTYSYDPAKPRGEKIIAASLKLNGTVLNPTGTYRVTSNSFLAAGGDNFTTLGQGTDKITTGDNDLTMLVNYFAKYSPITADATPRSTQGVADTTAPAGTYQLRSNAAWAGQTVSLKELSVSDDVTAADKIRKVVDWGDGTKPDTIYGDHGHTYAKAGKFTVVITLTDEAGNGSKAEFQGSATVTVTAQPGKFGLSKTWAWLSQPVTVTVKGITPDVTKLVVNWGDGKSSTVSPKSSTVSHVYAKNTAYTVKVTPYNATGAGKTVTVGTVKVLKDYYKPSVSLTKPAKPGHVSSWKTLHGKAADKGVGVAKVQVKLVQQRSGTWYYYNGAKWVKASSLSVANAKAKVVTTTKASWSIPVKGLAKGTLKVSYWAYDKVGNRSATYVHTVKLTK